MQQAEAAAVPATLVTGFLGSGKTTLLNGLLAHPAMGETAVIVNEFGEVGLDHVLIETAFEDAVLMKSGCICCTIRGDLVDTLGTLMERRRRGEIPPFRRVVIETTGLADPAPILHLLMSDPAVTKDYRLERVVTTVDAVNGAAQLDEHYESAKQAALADCLVLTKTDLADGAAAARLAERLRALNPTAPILPVVEGRADPAALLGEESPGGAEQRERRLDALAAAAARDPGHDHEHDAAGLSRHHGISSFCLVHEEPVAWPALGAWLGSLASLRGPDLLRVKGIVNVAGREGPVVIHGVQQVFHPPRELRRWPDADRRTRIVFITRNIPEAALRAFFAAMTART
jgi:G3E family GTPase